MNAHAKPARRPAPRTVLLRLTAVAVPALLLGGCHAAFWGNLMVMGVTIGLFFATLALGRSGPPTQAPADASRSAGATGTSPLA